MNGRLLAPSGLVALVALLLVLPFAPAAHGSVTQAECTGTTLGGSRVAWDSGKCVLLDRLLIMVAGDLDNAATQLETRSGWTAEQKLPLVKVILAKYTGQNLDLAGIKAEMAHFSSQSWAAIVELDALVSAAQLAPAVAADKFPSFVGGTISDQDYTQYAPVDSWTLPGAVDGDGDLTYTLSPELPAGLDFDGKARTISGTPASALEETRYTLTATDEDGDDTRLTFTIKVAAQVAHSLSKAGGDEQQGPGGSLLAEPFVVSLLDQVGNPYAGAPVAFEVTAGGGTLSALTDTTDALGRAAVALTLGQVPGTNTVEAVVAGLDPVIFTATGEVTPDFDGDGAIGPLDFYLFADAFGGSDPRFDLDGNGSVGLPDFFLFAESFGQEDRAKLVAMARELIGLPETPHLQNAPNPFNNQTVISWSVPAAGPARLEVFALTGQRVAVLHEGPVQAGAHRLRWDGRDDQGRLLGSGVYVYRLETAAGAQTRKLTLLR